jgi:hypothetical protein
MKSMIRAKAFLAANQNIAASRVIERPKNYAIKSNAKNGLKMVIAHVWDTSDDSDNHTSNYSGNETSDNESYEYSDHESYEYSESSHSDDECTAIWK